MTDVQAPPAPAEATIGHNSAAVGEILRDNPAAIFDEPDMLNQLVSELQEEIDAADVNLETNVGRNEVISRANGITKLKAAIDKAGLARTEEHRMAVKKVNEVRNQVKETLADLVAAARRPVTEWEAAEASRQSLVDDFFKALQAELPQSVADCEWWLDHLNEMESDLDPDVFRAQLADAQAALTARVEQVKANLKAARVVEAERAELEKLRREKAEREEREAEAQRQKDAEAAAALKAERDRAAEAERQLQAQRDAEAAEKAAEEQRKADAEHRERVQAEAAAAISKHGMISEAGAYDIVTAILAGNVPHVSLKF
ncbi:MAG: hypothetical protein CMF04_08950 [Hyphomonas sp.]|nr:hypothetical protein [Hyphomonas sp.]